MTLLYFLRITKVAQHKEIEAFCHFVQSLETKGKWINNYRIVQLAASLTLKFDWCV